MDHGCRKTSLPDLLSCKTVTSWISGTHQVPTGTTDGSRFTLTLAHPSRFELRNRGKHCESQAAHDVSCCEIRKIAEDNVHTRIDKFE